MSNYFNSDSTTVYEPTTVAELSATGPAEAQSTTSEKAYVQQFSISRFSHHFDNIPRQMSYSWDAFCKAFSVHASRRTKAGPVWSPVSYNKGETRANQGVEFVYFAVIDVDNGTPCEDVIKRFEGHAFLVHSSYSHTAALAKYRMILPLAEPVPASEWYGVWSRINEMAGGCNDASTKDPARIYYTPAHPVGDTEHFVHVGSGRLLSLDDLPAMPEEIKSKPITFHRKVQSGRLPEIEGIESSGPDLNYEQGLTHVVKRCAFMQFASAPENQDELPEPLWMAMISNACRFENSEAWIHEASSKHSGYDENETDNRINRYREASPPNTCQRIRELGFQNCPSGGCAGPIGTVAKAPAALGAWMFHRQLTTEETVDNQFPGEYSVGGSFMVKPHGVYQVVQKKDDEPEYVKLCSRIDVTALTRDVESTNWGTELCFTDPDGVRKTWALPMELLASSGESYRASLFRMGATIEPSKRAREGLAAYLVAAKPEGRAISVRQPGWSANGMFVLPDAVYGESDERLVFETKDPDEIKRFSRKGTLDSWQQNVAVPCLGNSRAVLSICIGLASPLLALLGEDNGGFHLRGNSSSGKTVCLGLGSSVWGGGSLIRTWNATTNGLEGVATMHNDVLLPLDELGQADGKAAGEAAYMLGNGQGKSRADKNGDARAAKRFRNLVLSSGEKSLSDVMAQVGQSSMAGQDVRMVEIAADAGAGYGVFENIHGAKTSQIFAEALKHAVTQHHGHAGRAFVNLLADPKLQPKLIEAIRAAMQRFLDVNVPAGATGQVGRVGRRFGLVAAAGELCIELGILPWPSGEAVEAARKCLAGWIEQRGGIGNQEEEKTIAQVRRFIELHGESRFTPLGIEGIETNITSKTINRAGFRRLGEDGRMEYLISPEAYKSEVCHGLNFTATTKILVSKGLLAVKAGKPQVEIRVQGHGKMRLYHLKADILGEYVSPSGKEETAMRQSFTSALAIKYNI